MHPNPHDAQHCRRAAFATLLTILIVAGVAGGQDSSDPVPKVYKDGPSLRFEFPEMRVGIAEYDEGPTGTTVFYFPNGVKGAVDVRGGAPGTTKCDRPYERV